MCDGRSAPGLLPPLVLLRLRHRSAHTLQTDTGSHSRSVFGDIMGCLFTPDMSVDFNVIENELKQSSN